jgi:hypothetical protein
MGLSGVVYIVWVARPGLMIAVRQSAQHSCVGQLCKHSCVGCCVDSSWLHKPSWWGGGCKHSSQQGCSSTVCSSCRSQALIRALCWLSSIYICATGGSVCPRCVDCGLFVASWCCSAWLFQQGAPVLQQVYHQPQRTPEACIGVAPATAKPHKRCHDAACLFTPDCLRA